MSRVLAQTEERMIAERHREEVWSLQAFLRGHPLDTWALGLAFCAAPISIAVCEIFLFLGVIARAIRCLRGDAKFRVPRIFYFWLIWAVLEVVAWAVSPDRRSGTGELRHLFLIAAIFFMVPALNDGKNRLMVWRGIFLASTLSSVFLLGDFATRLITYRSSIGSADEMSFYLRSGGLLNHWMVYGTVEILVIAGFLCFWSLYPEERRRWWPVAVIQALAILLSLTRMVWIVGFMLLAIDLAWRRSKWVWALPLVPLALYFVAPGPVRIRINESLQPDFYSNAERLQMARVGWKMIEEKPLTGVGPGRVDALYLSYLSPRDPVPAYHGHLHNNLIQLAAELGVPVALAAVGTAVLLFLDLGKAMRAAVTREEQFACRAGLLGFTGFVLSGIFDYTFGHSLGLILLGFVVLSPLIPREKTGLDWNQERTI